MSIRCVNTGGTTKTGSVYMNINKVQAQLHMFLLANWNSWKTIYKNISLGSGIDHQINSSNNHTTKIIMRNKATENKTKINRSLYYE